MPGELIKTIKEKLIEIIEGIETSETFDGFKGIYGYTVNSDELEGDPVLVIRFIGTDNDDPGNTTVENMRVFKYNAQILIQRDENTLNQELERRMEYTLGHLIYELDKNYANELWDELQTATGEMNYGDSNYYICNVSIDVRKLVDIS